MATLASSTAQDDESLRKGKGRGKREPGKKYYKVVIRKLPLSNYTEQSFQEDVNKLIQKLNLPDSSIKYEHFIQGKLRYVVSLR